MTNRSTYFFIDRTAKDILFLFLHCIELKQNTWRPPGPPETIGRWYNTIYYKEVFSWATQRRRQPKPSEDIIRMKHTRHTLALATCNDETRQASHKPHIYSRSSKIDEASSNELKPHHFKHSIKTLNFRRNPATIYQLPSNWRTHTRSTPNRKWH